MGSDFPEIAKNGRKEKEGGSETRGGPIKTKTKGAS